MDNITTFTWRKSDRFYDILAGIFAVLSLGIVPTINVFYPAFGLRLRTLPAENPSDADFVIANIGTDEGPKEVVCVVNHMVNVIDNEHIISFQADCQRYCGTSLEKFQVYKVDDVPHNMRRFLQATTSHVEKSERDILALKYGPNEMDIPPTDLFAITVRHSLNPLIIFGYFSIIIWGLEGYYAWTGFLIFMVLATIYVLVEWTSYNLRRLRELAGQHSDVQLIETMAISGMGTTSENKDKDSDKDKGVDKDKTVTVSDATLVVGDRFVLMEDMILPCDIILISGTYILRSIYTPCQPTRSTHTINTPTKYTLSTPPINTLSQHPLSTHSLNTPYQHTLSTPPSHILLTHLSPLPSHIRSCGGGRIDAHRGIDSRAKTADRYYRAWVGVRVRVGVRT